MGINRTHLVCRRSARMAHCAVFIDRVRRSRLEFETWANAWPTQGGLCSDKRGNGGKVVSAAAVMVAIYR